jgi:long-chain acyl-CoA synthetase
MVPHRRPRLFRCGRHLFLTGRKKEVIVLSNGKNVYPDEIEAHYLKSPFIKEIAVMGLEGKPGEGGDRLHAVIVPNFDVLRQRKIVNAKEAFASTLKACRPKSPPPSVLAVTKSGRTICLAPPPAKSNASKSKSESGANQRREVDDDSDLPAEKPLTADEAAWLDQPDVQRGLKIVRETARTIPPTMRPALNLELDLGLDSMQRVELLSRLEEELGGNVEESQLAEIYTVRDLLDAVLASAASGAGARNARHLRRMEGHPGRRSRRPRRARAGSSQPRHRYALVHGHATHSDDRPRPL